MKLLSVTCLLLFSALTSAVPNPAALPDALVEDEAEIVARDAGADTASLAVVGSGDDNGARLSTRTQEQYCWRGWDQKNYQGNSLQECCYWTCCYIHEEMLRNRLYSAKATKSPSGGVYLWTGDNCNGESRWVDFEGWWNLEKAPAYNSYSKKL